MPRGIFWGANSVPPIVRTSRAQQRCISNNSMPTGSLDEMDPFLENHDLLTSQLHKEKQVTWMGLYLLKKLNQHLITFQKIQHWPHMVSLVNSSKHLRKKWYQLPTLSSRKIEEGTLCNNCNKRHYANTKTKWGYYKKENYRPSSSRNRSKLLVVTSYDTEGSGQITGEK